MPSLLLEIGCEELPAGACREAEAQLPVLAERELGAAPDRLFIGPRRLALLFEDIAERTADEWIKGPPVELREKAAPGFAKKHGVKVGELMERDGFLGLERRGRPLREVVPERLDAIVRGLSFSKSMRWDDSGLRFARPVRWLCAKLDDETVAGFGDSSHGHRYTHGEVPIPTARDYVECLRAANVEPDQEARLATIRAGLAEVGLAEPNEKVLAEVVHLAEWPVVLRGSFDERFLALPRRVVETAMESHQRYFPLGGLAVAFVANGGEPVVMAAAGSGQAARSGAPAPGAAQPAGDYLGEATCATCHDQSYKGTKHALMLNERTPAATHGCESCHGPGKAHAESRDPALIKNPKKLRPAEVSDICTSCHNRASHALWEGSQHF